MYIRLTILIILLPGYLLSQNLSFVEADSITYALYMQENWKGLAKAGRKTQKAGYDYHYLNLRLGIAHFKLRQYARAENYLKKAHLQDPSSEINKLYLYFSAIENENVFLSANVYSSISDSLKLLYGLNLHKPVTSINLEAGNRFSSNTDTAGNIGFAQIGLSHFPTKKIGIYHSYTYVEQLDNTWGSYQQHQYYIGLGHYLANSLSLDLALHWAGFQSQYDFSFDSLAGYSYKAPEFPIDYGLDTLTITNIHYKGNYYQNSLYKSIGATYKSGPFSFSVFSGLQTEWRRPELVKQQTNQLLITQYWINYAVSKSETVKGPEIEIKKPSVHTQTITGATMAYVMPKERITIGIKVFQPLQMAEKPVVSPFINMRNRFYKLNFSYFYKGPYIVADDYGSFLINSYDIIHNRYAVGITANIYQNILFSANYQFEERTDAVSLHRYNLNSFAIGLKVIL